VREQAIILFQNITTGSQEIAFTMKGLGTERLVNLLQTAMSRNDSETVEHVSALPLLTTRVSCFTGHPRNEQHSNRIAARAISDK
jgi:hypothetical protein